jgi:type IV secretory pathway TrbL component
MSEVTETWYYGGDGKAVGPHTFAELQLMAASGKLAPETLVTNGDAGWRPARDVEGLEFAPASHLGYRAPAEGGAAVTARTVQLFAQTSLWVRIVSVILIIGCALMVLGGLFMIAMGALAPSGQGETALLGIVYIVMAIFYAIPAVLLSRYASQCRSFANLRHEQLLEKAVETHKSFWKYSAILMLVVIALYLVVIAAAVVIGVVFHGV